jgi:hypothetical protein
VLSLAVASGNNQCQVTLPNFANTGPGSRLAFTAWTDGVNVPIRTITVPETNTTFQAIYADPQYLLTPAASPESGGTVTVSPQSPSSRLGLKSFPIENVSA